MSTQTVNRIPQAGGEVQARIRSAVKGLLGMNGLYQKDLAEPLGTSPNNINNKLKGRNKFTIEDVEAIARFFGVDVVDVLDPGRWRPRGPRDGGAIRPVVVGGQEPAGFRRLKPRALLELAIPAQRLAEAA